MTGRFVIGLAIGLLLPLTAAMAADEFIPRRQSAPPGPPLSPTQALEKMEVPEGFHVELVASEPDLTNPVAMAFDDRGRIFVTESFEYPRLEPGPGRDRIKILEDTDGDGRTDSVKIFAEGLNIPSGIAVGFGGVWVANAPDILFLEDTDGDDRADKQTVIATGFGRDDTHELPNALTWGPDGFLYGLNGVFNRSRVTQGDQTFDFTCAMFRIDPVSHRFDLFCEGTSNPWGITFDDQGSAFISACVIDHLWHLTETGYYHRQGGPYPPHTWKIDSIVNHQHQMAAYCGIEYFDSPAYPAEYRNKLYMGNIHGGCINVDSVQPFGSTYRATPHPDFLTANDVWFMPVAQKVGPDGCLYVLDWYDRYHCYQDATADPTGVDRGHGRLYRIVYNERPQPRHADLAALEDRQLVELLSDENIFLRQRAAVILSSRLRSDRNANLNQATWQSMYDRLVHSVTASESATPLYLMTTLLNAPQMTPEALLAMLQLDDPLTQSWAVRAAATRGIRSPEVVEQIASLAAHADPRVRVQVAIAAGKMTGGDATRWLINVLAHSDDDGSLPQIVWRNLEPRVLDDQDRIIDELAAQAGAAAGNSGTIPLLMQMSPRIATRMLSELRPDLSGPADARTLASVLRIASLLADTLPQQADQVLQAVVEQLQTRGLQAAVAKPHLLQWVAASDHSSVQSLQLRCFAGEPEAIAEATSQLLALDRPMPQRLSLLATLAPLDDHALSRALEQWVTLSGEEAANTPEWRDAVLSAVVEHGDDELRGRLVAQMSTLPVGVQATVVERLSQRENTALILLAEIAAERLGKELVSPNQIRLLASSRSEAVRDATRAIWGTVRTEDSQSRQKVVAEVSKLLSETHGDANRGWVVYDRICGQCHELHDRGYEVGPSITRNGRGSFEQLVVSVFDPSLVIGDAYKSVTVLTDDGRLINGIVTEQSDQRLVLKIQGGKLEVIPTGDIEQMRQNPQSLMPEGLEQQMTPQELADLFALLSLDQPPAAAENATIVGTPEALHTQP